MNLHILGICGTFMGSIAVLARALGHQVSGSDKDVYPPMSTHLEEQGIELQDGYDPAHLHPGIDLVLVGNTISRGNPALEYMLDAGIAYQSGPQWLAEHVLSGKHVLAVAGTHGKTTCSSMLAWILESCGLQPGFLIGGIAENFGISARTGTSGYFVIEADEYDTAFFDKRSKFIHYRPTTLLINNIEYDHADIFENIASVRKQFHHLVRTIPAKGQIIRHANDREIDKVLELGCWTPVSSFAGTDADWSLQAGARDYSSFEVYFRDARQGQVDWSLIGRHNAENALAAIAAAANAGAAPGAACAALNGFLSVRRRLQKLGSAGGVTVYDDFAHHPTAISATLAALRANVGATSRIIAVLEPRSNTMRMGIHRDTLGPSLDAADLVLVYEPPGLDWDLGQSLKTALAGKLCGVYGDIDEIINTIIQHRQEGDQVLIMSNGGFQGIHAKVLEKLQSS